MEFEKKLKDDLLRYLRAEGKVDEILPDCPDLDERWNDVAKAYLPDGLREFQQYPICSLGWIMLVGMALARFWDEDWEKYADQSGETLYTDLRDARGYDNLDDYILESILHLDKSQAEQTASLTGECAARTLSALQHSGIEPGTRQAAEAYIAALHSLYTMGIAVELNRLGYHMTPLGS